MTWLLQSVAKDDIRDMWGVVAPLLEPAIVATKGRTDMATAFRQLGEGATILWVAYDDIEQVAVAAFITRVAQYPLKRMLVVDACGGTRMGEWLDTVVGVFESFAADSGLDGVEMYGRPGWTRALRPYGWGTTLVLCESNAVVAGKLRQEAKNF